MEDEKVTTFAPADEQEPEALPTAVEMAMRRAAEAKPVGSRKKKRILPLHEWVLVRRLYDSDELTASGMMIAANKERSSVGQVVKVGPKVVGISEGDEVIYTNFALDLEGIEQATGEKELQLLRFEEVYARLEDEE